jgi:hypothetical protein
LTWVWLETEKLVITKIIATIYFRIFAENLISFFLIVIIEVLIVVVAWLSFIQINRQSTRDRKEIGEIQEMNNYRCKLLRKLLEILTRASQRFNPCANKCLLF